MRRAPAVLSLLLLSLLPALDAHGVTLYVRRVVIKDGGAITPGDLVQTTGEISPATREALDRSIGTIADHTLLIPSVSYKALFNSPGGENLILVGKRTLVIPSGSTDERSALLLDRLADYLETQGGIGQGTVELSDVRITWLTEGALSDGMTLKQIRLDRKSGLAFGSAEFSFQAAGIPGAASGRITLKITQDVLAAAQPVYSVKVNDSVSVLFRKGSILIEMSGKALASAREGERVEVFVPDSKMSFQGVVTGSKAVSVEIE